MNDVYRLTIRMNIGTIFISDYKTFEQADAIRTKIFGYDERQLYNWTSGNVSVTIPIKNISSVSIQCLELHDREKLDRLEKYADEFGLTFESYYDTICIREANQN